MNIGNPFDRYKWSGPIFRELLSCPLIAKLWEDLTNLYEEVCQPFLRANGVPEEVMQPRLQPRPLPSVPSLRPFGLHWTLATTEIMPKGYGLRCVSPERHPPACRDFQPLTPLQII